MPVDLVFALVALHLPRVDLVTQRVKVRDSARQALAGKHTELDLGHVEPAAVLGGVMERQAAQETVRLLGREGLVERRAVMRVQVVHDQVRLFGFGIVDIEQFFDLPRPVNPRLAPGGCATAGSAMA